MESIVGVMKKVAEQEAQRIHTTELGVVSAVFPHADEGDKDNYQCSVKLKNRKQADGSDFELRKVPVATSYMGLVAIPNVGDLVLVSFLSGDINAPVIIGRLYNDEDRPPANKAKEFLLQHDIKEGGSIKLDEAGKIIVTSKNKKNIMTIEDEKIEAVTEKTKLLLEKENISINNANCKITIEGANILIDNGSCKIKVESGGVTIDTGSSPINLKSMGNVKIEGSPAPGSISIGTMGPQGAVGDNDDIILSMHTHVGNLGAPCPIMVPMEKINSIQAKMRNTKVG
jgi:phage baseplate assembly protein V